MYIYIFIYVNIYIYIFIYIVVWGGRVCIIKDGQVRFFWYEQTIDKLPFGRRANGNRIKILLQIFGYHLRLKCKWPCCNMPVPPAFLHIWLPVSDASLPACSACRHACRSVSVFLSTSLPSCLFVWSIENNGNQQTFLCLPQTFLCLPQTFLCLPQSVIDNRN